jgi:tetratricopeptide (TPR) repeat protein
MGMALELGKALLRQGRPGEARDVLETTRASAPDWDEAQSAFASALLETGDVDGARAAALRAVESNPAFAEAWNVLSQVERRGGPAKLCEDKARGLAADRPFDPAAWEALLNVLEGPETVGERIDAARRITILRPAEWTSWDMLAWTFIEGNRLDEALEACAPPLLREIPPELRGRRASIQAMRGDVGGAITTMRQVLASAPTFERGWRWMADWCREAGNVQGYRDATEQLVRLMPRSAVALGMRCEARIVSSKGAAAKSQERRLAREDLARAHALDPTYRYAAEEYVVLCLDDGDAASALSWTEALKDGVPLASRAINLARLAGNGRDTTLAARALRALWDVENATESDIDLVMEGLRRGRLQGAMAGILKEAGSGRPLSPPISRIVMTFACQLSDFASADALLADPAATESSWRTLAAVWLDQQARLDRTASILRFIAKYDARLRAHRDSWSAALASLVNSSLWEQATTWSDDWETRKEVRAWDLRLRTLALGRLRRWGPAVVVSREALARALPDERPAMQACHALAMAMTGDSRAAIEVVPTRTQFKLSRFDQFCYFLTRALTAFDEPAGPGRQRPFARARGFLSSAEKAAADWKSSDILRAYHEMAIGKIARRRGGPTGFFWWLHKRGYIS